MAVFQFTSRRVELEFPGGIKHSLPLNEEMRQKVETASKELLDKTNALRGKGATAENLEALCDYTLDAVDATGSFRNAAQAKASRHLLVVIHRLVVDSDLVALLHAAGSDRCNLPSPEVQNQNST